MDVIKKKGKKVFAIKNTNSQNVNKTYLLHPRPWHIKKNRKDRLVIRTYFTR